MATQNEIAPTIEPLEQLIERLHREPLRVWSIVITIFGDAVVPRGGVVWLGTLQAITQRLGIEAGALRAAMSRLTRDGWLERERRGRKSYYALAPDGRHAFDMATRRIYAADDPSWSGDWTLALLTDETARARDARLRKLARFGFASPVNGVYLRPETTEAPSAAEALSGMVVFRARGQETEDLCALAASVWDFALIEQAYGHFCAIYGPIESSPIEVSKLAPIDAMALRTLLIHDFRRVVLKDPRLPEDLVAPSATAIEARALVQSLYRQVLLQSEVWLDQCVGAPTGPLPPPSREFHERFGGLEKQKCYQNIC